MIVSRKELAEATEPSSAELVELQLILRRKAR
jgi:hypothetical protein